MSWNLWWRFGPWERRQEAIARVLEEQRPDVAGLQEVWVEDGGANQAEWLAERLGLHATIGELRFYDGLAFTNAVLSRWPVAEACCEWLHRADGTDSHRQVVFTAIEAPFGRLPFVTTHLEWQFDASADRAVQAAEVARVVGERRNDPAEGFPTIVTGDFNAEPDADEIRSLNGSSRPPVPGLVFTDAWRAAGDGSAGLTWDRANEHLADATWPQRRLDYVFVSWPRPKPLGSVARCWLAGTEPVDGVTPSDHYAVVADLRTDRPGG
jgi:endonuclease/exonuclease/phosphatase family metal-dependent hydrolase